MVRHIASSIIWRMSIPNSSTARPSTAAISAAVTVGIVDRRLTGKPGVVSITVDAPRSVPPGRQHP